MVLIEPPSVTARNGSRHQLSETAMLALRALDIGYEKIQRIDGLELIMVRFARHLGSSKFQITELGRVFLYDPVDPGGWGEVSRWV